MIKLEPKRSRIIRNAKNLVKPNLNIPTDWSFIGFHYFHPCSSFFLLIIEISMGQCRRIIINCMLYLFELKMWEIWLCTTFYHPLLIEVKILPVMTGIGVGVGGLRYCCAVVWGYISFLCEVCSAPLILCTAALKDISEPLWVCPWL